jgi:hypothetical protein
MSGVVVALILVFVLYLICCAFGMVNYYEPEVKFENQLNKLLKNVTDMEWTFYRKVFNKIKYTDPKSWEITTVKNPDNPLEPGDIYEIQVGYQLCLKTLKITNNNGTSKYECTALEILSGKKCEISIIPPKEQMELYDLFVNYAIYKLELYQKKIEEDEKKQISKAHQDLIKEANSKFVI